MEDPSPPADYLEPVWPPSARGREPWPALTDWKHLAPEGVRYHWLKRSPDERATLAMLFDSFAQKFNDYQERMSDL